MLLRFILLSMLVTLASCNGDPKSVIGAVNDAANDADNDGTTVLGGSNFKQVSRTIAPGEYLELSHDLTSFD